VVHVGSDLSVFVLDATGSCSVLLASFTISVLAFFDAALCLAHKTVRLVRDNPGISLDEIARLVDVVRQFIGMRHGSADFPARLGLEQVSDGTANC